MKNLFLTNRVVYQAVRITSHRPFSKSLLRSGACGANFNCFIGLRGGFLPGWYKSLVFSINNEFKFLVMEDKQDKKKNGNGEDSPDEAPVKPEKNVPVKPDKNPDPTRIKPGVNEPEKTDPTRIEPQKPDKDGDK
jgi:hypothetical protein